MRGKEAQMRGSKSIRSAEEKKQKKCGYPVFPCEPQIFYPCLAWKNKGLDFFWILFFVSFLILILILILDFGFLFLIFFCSQLFLFRSQLSHFVPSYLILFPFIVFALSKQKRLALGNKNLAYRVILCIGTKEVILWKTKLVTLRTARLHLLETALLDSMVKVATATNAGFWVSILSDLSKS
jgi:hypothetical protein